MSLMAVAMSLGDHFMGDHKQHGAGRQAQTDGIGDGQAAGEPDPEQGAEGFEQAAADGDQHGQWRAKTGGAHGKRHR